MATRKTIVSIVIGIAVAMVVVAVAAIGSLAFFVKRHFNSQDISAPAALEELQRERAQLAGMNALVEIVDRQTIVHRPSADAPKKPLQVVRALVYDAKQRRLVHVDIPFWLVRLMPSGRVSMTNQDIDSDFSPGRLNLSVDDLERHGPGLVLDAQDPQSESHILVWTE